MIKQIKEFGEKQFSEHMKQTAINVAKKYGLNAGKDCNSTYNNEADAFKHAYMQYWLAFRTSSSIAKKLGDEHEFDLKGNPSNEQNMDLWNNQIGRELAEEMSEKFGRDIEVYTLDWFDEYDTKKIVEKIRNGELITNPNDKRRYKDMELERLTHNDKIYSKEEYEGLVGEEKDKAVKNFIDYVIDHDWKIPTKADLDKKVQSGELIYVDNYTRSDGTKVQGYYRRKPYYKKHQ